MYRMFKLKRTDSSSQEQGVLAQKVGKEWKAICPWHDDHDPSLAINKERLTFFCHGCGAKGIVLFSKPFLGTLPTSAPASGSLATGVAATKGSVATYDYKDAKGNLTFQVVRSAGKKFRIRRPEGNGGWVWNLKGVEPILYHLPEVLSGVNPVIIVEGEKDVDTLHKAGFTATTNPMGAGKWRQEYSQCLKGRCVVVVPDNDAPGKEHMRQVANAPRSPAQTVRYLELPRLSEGEDVSDWLVNGGTVEELKKLITEAKPLKPHLRLEEGFKGGEVATPSPAHMLNEPPLPKKPFEVTLRRVKVEEILAAPGSEDLAYLPFLGTEGFLVKGWSHIISAYPKVGKTELVFEVLRHLKDEKILYITEEPQSIWRQRVGKEDNVTFIFALGSEASAIIKAIREGEETVVVIDTVRSLLNIKDENDNAVIGKILTPLIATCREKGQTLLLLHHNRKSEGEHGVAIAGGHAFLGVVDIALELKRDTSPKKNRRQISGEARLIEIPETMYEKREGGFVLLGSPQDIRLEEVCDRMEEVLNSDWQTTKEVWEALGEPRPSSDQVRRALNALAKRGMVERNPKEEKSGAKYLFRQVALR